MAVRGDSWSVGVYPYVIAACLPKLPWAELPILLLNLLLRCSNELWRLCRAAQHVLPSGRQHVRVRQAGAPFSVLQVLQVLSLPETVDSINCVDCFDTTSWLWVRASRFERNGSTPGGCSLQTGRRLRQASLRAS